MQHQEGSGTPVLHIGRTVLKGEIGRGHQFSLLLAAEVCASAVVILDTSCSKVV
jgi:hypothetical protein